ncbi:hypothetical protein SLEP1_g24034 [Rubroshorea leprosula]|uniref:Uncharacterized protein n=1 Tax=Rubroshorea leprosula TaxID=152421 RepID=A0AAV5JJJ1_9ROSI|nr:hypothetical protein SLEP1_g24034 [Rubroshorea leprosula]
MIPTGFRDRKTTWRRQLREGLWSYGILLTDQMHSGAEGDIQGTD